MFLNIDKREIGLSLVRLIIGLIILKNIIFLFPYADIFFSKAAILPWQEFADFLTQMNLGFLTPIFETTTGVTIFMGTLAASAFCFCLGIGGTINGLLLYGLFLVFTQRNGLILDGSDNVTSVILIFLVLSNSYKYFSQSNLYPKFEKTLRAKPWVNKVTQLFALCLMVQVTYVYFFTGLAKAQGELWHNGTAVYYTMRVNEFMATDWNIWLTSNLYFVVIATYSTLILELAFPFLVWFRKTKIFVLMAMASVHIGIYIFMRIDNFSWVMIATYFAFITDEEYKAMYQKVINLGIVKRFIPSLSNKQPKLAA